MNFSKGIIPLLTLGMVLGIHRGYIALWQDGSDIPAQIYSYKADLLPQKEQAKLTDGIPIRDEAHLRTLLRDYLS